MGTHSTKAANHPTQLNHRIGRFDNEKVSQLAGDYCGPIGDFRNECMVSDLVAEPGFDKVRSLDAEAAR
jgi:hypothetical protein